MVDCLDYANCMRDAMLLKNEEKLNSPELSVSCDWKTKNRVRARMPASG